MLETLERRAEALDIVRVAGRRDGAQGTAVERAGEGDDLVALDLAFSPEVMPGRLDGAFERLGARIGEEDAVGKGVFDEPLAEPLAIGGVPVVNLQASTSGSDSDWVVKLIDVYPDENAGDPKMGGYELPVSLAIFRGRYREGFETARPIASDEVLAYRFDLPNANHVFKPGHRVMVQVQSSLFPLYDRNPQSFVPNIYFAKPGDYRKATQRVYHTAQLPSFIELPVL